MTTQTPEVTLNETQRKLIHTAMIQIGHASSNISNAMYLEGLSDPEVRQTWDELNMAWKRMWNVLHGGSPFTTTPPSLVNRFDSPRI